jgi:hypothetical protein
MKTRRYTSVTLGLLATSLLVAAPASRAQSLLPGVAIEKAITNPQDLDHPGIINVLDDPSLFKLSFDNAWAGHKAQVDQGICDAIASGNKQGVFPKGFTLYHQKSSVATTGTLQVQLAGNSELVLTYVVQHNYLEFTTTVPGNSFGAGLDPRFSFTYDLTMKVTLPIASMTRGLQVASATVTLSNVSKPDSHNFTADQANSVAAIIKAFGGPDFLAQFQQAIDGTQFSLKQQIQQALGQVNAPLQQLAQQGYTALSALPDIHTHRLTLRASVPETPMKLVVSQLTDRVKVDPKYSNLIHTFARVRFYNTEVIGQAAGATSAFTRLVPADVRTVPIHIDIQRDVHVVITGTGASTDIEPQGVPSGVMRSVDLTYDRTTGRITAPGTSPLGMAVVVLADRNKGVSFVATIDDNGPKPTEKLAHSSAGDLKRFTRP